MKRKEEEERKRKEEEERKRKEEEERKRKKEEERIRKEEEERRRKEEEKRIKDEEERKQKEDEEKNIYSEEEIRFRKEERKRIRLEEEERKKIEEEKLKENEQEKEKRKEREEEEKRKREEEKRLIIENQKKLRLQNNPSIQQEQINNNTQQNIANSQLNQTLIDMCNYGNIVKKEIETDNKSEEKEYIHTNELKNMNETTDKDLFALNLLAQNLESSGVQTVIEKDQTKSNEEEALTNLQFVVNGLYYKKKYVLKFDFGEEKNDKLLKEKEEYNNFVNKLKHKLSKDYGVKPEQIIVTCPEKGSFKVQIIFASDEFNQLDTNEFENKFRNEVEYPELKNLKTIHTDVMMGACKLSKTQLDPRGNRSEGWGINENRGNKPYYPPLGWTGIGLKVWDKYENNTWIGMSNNPGEWCVAYHGVGSGQSSDDVKKVTGLIYKGSFRPGGGQAHKYCPDKYHPGHNVGEGVYCTPKIEIANGYAGKSEINGKSYKTVLMVRVKPEAIRNCANCPGANNDNYWVVNGTTDEIRPYRILYKEC